MKILGFEPNQVTPIRIIFAHGKKLNLLDTNTLYDLSPEQYREKWGLPADYPMVAPNYAQARSRLAREMGLGRKPGTKIKKKTRA